MKFITEQNLRDLYKQKPFTTYELPDGSRLTPGGRQFLLDRGIDLYDMDKPKPEPVPPKEEPAPAAEEAAPEAPPKEETPFVTVIRGSHSPARGGGKEKFSLVLRTIEMDFLLAMDQVSDHDICLLQQMTNMYRQLELIGAAAKEGSAIPELYCKACSGISSENHSQCLGDCFAISDFYMQMANRHVIFTLGKLRSELEELAYDTAEYLAEDAQKQNVADALYQIVNGLSQLICTAVGGKECLRNG